MVDLAPNVKLGKTDEKDEFWFHLLFHPRFKIFVEGMASKCVKATPLCIQKPLTKQ